MSSVGGGSLEMTNVCAYFCILCKYFTINMHTLQGQGRCWNPMDGLCEARREQGSVLDGEHTDSQKGSSVCTGRYIGHRI